MKQIKLNYLLTALVLTTLFSACHKDKVIAPVTMPIAERAGVYVLNQGGFGNNNSTLTYYDYATKTLTSDFFAQANSGSKLGDTGNDIGIYGSKMYITVNKSNRLDIVNAKTGKIIKQDSIHLCRSVVFYGPNAFVTSYDGNVSVIDTATSTISKTITVGRNPEQMVVVGTKLYVANSGGLDFGNPDNTVSVIDLTTLTETKKITVIANPVSVAADTYGNIYVISLGDYNTIMAGMSVIDSRIDAIVSKPVVNLGYNIPIATNGDFVYYATADNKVAVYNAKTQTAASSNFITDGTVITTVYAIAVDPTTGEVFVTDAKDYASDGLLYVFDKTGKKEYTIETGINPGKIAFVNK